MTVDELRARPFITVDEWSEVYAIRSKSAAYRALERGDVTGAKKVGGSWRIPTPPILRELGVSTDAPEQPENVTPIRRSASR